MKSILLFFVIRIFFCHAEDNNRYKNDNVLNNQIDNNHIHENYHNIEHNNMMINNISSNNVGKNLSVNAREIESYCRILNILIEMNDAVIKHILNKNKEDNLDIKSVEHIIASIKLNHENCQINDYNEYRLLVYSTLLDVMKNDWRRTYQFYHYARREILPILLRIRDDLHRFRFNCLLNNHDIFYEQDDE